MKKFLTLVLAALMLVPMAIGVSAVPVYPGDSSIITPDGNDFVTAEEFETLLDFWKYLQRDEVEDFYAELGKYFANGIQTRWIDKCDKCGGVSDYEILKGDIYYDCRKCDDSGVIKYERKDECDQYYEGWINGKCPVCRKEAGYFIRNDKLYCYCMNCQTSYYITNVNNSYYPDWGFGYYDYDIDVICTEGGTYYIDGRNSADYGENRTITFTPKSGYVLTDVVVNGKSYGAASSITLTVKSDVVVHAYFAKVNVWQYRDFTTVVKGGGTVTVTKNGVKVDPGKFTARYGDVVVYTFTPANSNYYVKSLMVDGVTVSAYNTKNYVFDRITEGHKIEVEFGWKSPYVDVSSGYMSAVEFVTEAGLMGEYGEAGSKTFEGTKAISAKMFVATLAEMADEKKVLSTNEDRIAWAIENKVISKDTNLDVVCTVQMACDIVREYLLTLEDIKDIDFDGIKNRDTAKEVSVKINMVSEKIYEDNRQLVRYDLAAICRLLANLKYTAK